MTKLLPLCLLLTVITPAWGQKKGFASEALQQKAQQLAEETPYARVVYQFTENYLSELLSLTDKERQRKMTADGILIEKGGTDRLGHTSDGTSLTISSKENRYTVCFVNEKDTLLKISFPMSYQLIRQKKLIELETEFVSELTGVEQVEVAKKSTVNKEDLVQTIPPFYVRKGISYYIESVNNDSYYQEDNGQMVLVCHSSHILESARNLLLSEEVPHELSIDLSVRRYGFKKDKIDIPLKRWIVYCKEKGCDLYMGVEEMKTDRLRAVVFAVNEAFKYNHVLTVELPYALLDEKKGRLEADITIFVPTHNLTDLFAEMAVDNN